MLTLQSGQFKRVYLLLVGTLMVEFEWEPEQKVDPEKRPAEDFCKMFLPMMLIGTDLLPTQ